MDTLEVKRIILDRVPALEDISANISWDKIALKFNKRIEPSHKPKDDIITSSCFLDYIISSLGSDENAKANLDTVNAIDSEISKALEYCKAHQQFKGKIKDLVNKMLVDMDEDVFGTNSAFKNWINELFVFNALTGYNNYELIDIERPFNAQRTDERVKTCDFVCKDKENEEIWFEVVTFQGINPAKQENSVTMCDFIKQKIACKYKEKTQGLSQKGIPNLKIIPIIEYVDGLEKFDIMLNMDISIEPLSVMKNNIDGKVYVEIRPLDDYLSQIRVQAVKP
jgi:hypothetical protein